MQYSTRQRKKLIDMLEMHRDETLSAEQIIAYMGVNSVSRSAVYRNLASLGAEGFVKRIVVSGTNKAFYRYVKAPECKDHLHLECSRCGKTFHLNVPSTNVLIDNVKQDTDFDVDSASTVLYGVCKKCRQ